MRQNLNAWKNSLRSRCKLGSWSANGLEHVHIFKEKILSGHGQKSNSGDATMATAPSGTVFAALVLIPMLLLSMVTKPEPGLKQRVLAAVRWAIWDQPWPAGEWKREWETLRRGCFSNKVLKMRHRCCLQVEEEESILQTRRQEKLWITFRRISRTWF